MTPTEPTNTLGYGEMNRSQRRKFAKQARMFKGEGRENFRLMNKAAQVKERHESFKAVKNIMPSELPHKCGKEDCEICRPNLHKAM